MGAAKPWSARPGRIQTAPTPGCGSGASTCRLAPAEARAGLAEVGKPGLGPRAPLRPLPPAAARLLHRSRDRSTHGQRQGQGRRRRTRGRGRRSALALPPLRSCSQLPAWQPGQSRLHGGPASRLLCPGVRGAGDRLPELALPATQDRCPSLPLGTALAQARSGHPGLSTMQPPPRQTFLQRLLYVCTQVSVPSALGPRLLLI